MKVFLSAILLGACAFGGAFLGSYGTKFFANDTATAPEESSGSPATPDSEPAETTPMIPPAEPDVDAPDARVLQPTLPPLSDLEIQRGVILAEGEIVVPESEIGGVAILGGRYLGGAIGNGEFKAQGGLGAISAIPSVDRECRIEAYTLTYIAKRRDPVASINQGSRYNDKSKRLVFQAKPGDKYIYDNVKIKCSGDTTARSANSLAFSLR